MVSSAGNDCIPSPSKGATTRLFVKSSSPLSYHSCSKTCYVHAFHLSGTWWEIEIGIVAARIRNDVSYTAAHLPFRSDICTGSPCSAICSRLWHHLFEGHGIYRARKLHATLPPTRYYANLFFLERNEGSK